MYKTIEITEKRCSKCGEVKPVEEFYKDKIKKYGIKNECKICTKQINVKWYDNNREKALRLLKIWRKNNIEKAKNRVNEWKKKNTERVKKKNLEYYKNNIERIRKQQLMYSSTLHESYIKAAIHRKTGLTAAEIDALETDVISAQRKRIEIHRKVKQIKTT